MRAGYLGMALLLTAAVLPAQADSVSIGVGFGHRPYGHYFYRHYPYGYPRYYYYPHCPPYYPYPPYDYYYYGPPAAVYHDYDQPDTNDWPKEKDADRKDHGAFLTARAWTDLADGRFDDAADRFSDVIDDHPSLGLPRIGYALAIARLGRLPRGVVEMRSALYYDPKALNYVPRNELLDAKIEHIFQQYQQSLDRAYMLADPHFMIACLEYISGQKHKARSALDTAVKNGDDSVTARNLKNLLDAGRSQKTTPKPTPEAEEPPQY